MREAAALPFEPSDALLRHLDPVLPERVDRLVVDAGRAIGTEHEVEAPLRHHERDARPAGAVAVDRKGWIAHCPAIAIRAVKDALAIHLAEAVDLRQVVDDPRRDQELARSELLAGREPDVEAGIFRAHRVDD